MKRTILLVWLGSLILAAPAFAARGPCTDTTEVTTFAAGTVISSTPATLCSVQFLATASNGFCQVVDSPDGTLGHAQARVVSEPGAATSGNSAQQFFGDSGYRTRFGLTVASDDGRCVLHWGP